MINQLLAKAITQSLNQNPPKQVDLSAYYGNNNLLETALVDNAEISTLEGDLTSLSKKTNIYFRPVYQFFHDDTYHYINIGTFFLNYVIDGSLYESYRGSMGSHNNDKRIDLYMTLKDKLNLLIPFELILKVEKVKMPIDVRMAVIQNPFHECFRCLLTPAPVAGIAINSDLRKLIGYVVHPDSFTELLADNVSENQKILLQYDTKNALNILKFKYGIDIDESVIARLDKLESDLMNTQNEFNTSVIDIDVNGFD